MWTLLVVLLLTISNVFMTFAWYGHLNFKSTPLWIVIFASWGIAFFEYCFQVPANRIGHSHQLSAAQLKVMQELITLVVFSLFAALYLREPLRWNHYVAFVLILAAVVFVFGFRDPAAAGQSTKSTEFDPSVAGVASSPGETRGA